MALRPGRPGAAETAHELLTLLADACDGDVESFVTIRERRETETRGGAPESTEAARSSTAAVRVVSGGRTVLAATTDLSRAGRAALVRRISSLHGLADPDPCAALPRAVAGAVRGGERDARLVGLDAAEMAGIAARLERAASARGIANLRKPSFRIDVEETAVASSLGIDAGYARAVWSLSVTAMAADRNGMVAAWEADDGVSLSAADPEEVGRRAAEAALARRGPKRCPTGRLPVIFDPVTAIALLELVGQAASGEAVALGRSFLAGLAGRPWAAPGITIVDDGALPGGTASRPADDEGSPCGRTVVVRDGIVAGFLHNARSGSRAGEPSTGNAVRPSPHAVPAVGPTNLTLLPGGAADLRAVAGRAVEITEILGLHGANPVTGEVSVGIEGFLVENGRRSHPFKGGGLGTTVGEIFAGIVALGAATRTLGGVSSPAILTGPLAVSG